MLFSQHLVPKSIKLPFNWCADYFDGTYLTEYDLQTHQPNNFYTINQQNTIKFGLFGQNMKFYYETFNGIFILNDKKLKIIYQEDNGKIHELTNNSNKKDIITYKEAFADFNHQNGIQKSNTTSINFGYKTIYKNEDLELNFQPIISLPFNQSAFLEIKLTSNKTLNGQLIFYSNGYKVERIDAPMEQGYSYQTKWTIKM